MNNLAPEEVLFTTPDNRILRPKYDSLVINTVTATNLNVTNINGSVVSGTLVSTNSVQTISNKSLVDASTYIVDSTDSSIKTQFDATGAANTLSIIRTNVPLTNTTRIYTITDPGADAGVVLTEGAQTINGVKTFTALTVTGSAMDSITKITSAGTKINTIQMDHVTAAGLPTDMIISTSTEADINIALAPKGLGSFTLRLPDATSAGGNARGQSAVDLQLTRNAATQVASGARSFVAGSYNTASAADSYAIGYRAQSIHSGSMVLTDNTAADFSSTSVQQLSSRFTGGYRFTGGPFNINDIFITNTSGSVQTVGAVTNTAVSATLTNNYASLVHVECIGTTVGGSSAYIKFNVKINTVAGVATVGSAFDTWVISDFAGVNATATTSGLTLNINITGSAGNTINWKSTCRILQSNY